MERIIMTKISGIYQIVNKVNGKKYIGQSTNIYHRLYKHKHELKNNYHHNDHLQNSYNKYGEDCFDFLILHICPVQDLDEAEITYIGMFNTTNNKYGYNMEGGGHLNKVVHQDTKNKLQQLVKDRWANMSEEERNERNHNVHLGLRKHWDNLTPQELEEKIKHMHNGADWEDPIYCQLVNIKGQLAQSQIPWHRVSYGGTYTRKRDGKTIQCYRYQWKDENGKQHKIESNRFSKLKDKVIAKGLPWYNLKQEYNRLLKIYNSK